MAASQGSNEHRHIGSGPDCHHQKQTETDKAKKTCPTTRAVKPKRPLLVNPKSPKVEGEQQCQAHILSWGTVYSVITVDNLYSPTVASIFCLAFATSFFTLPSVSYRAAGALFLAKDLHHNIPITTSALSSLSPASQPIFRQMSKFTCVRTRLTILSKLSTRLPSIHLRYTVHERTRQCSPPPVFLLCSGHTIIVPPEGSWYTPFRPRFLANFIFPWSPLTHLDVLAG